MKKVTKLLGSLLVMVLLNSWVMAQMPDAITITPETATADDELTLTLDVSKACVPSGKNSVDQAGKVCMHSGYGDIAGNTWQNVVAWDQAGKDGTPTQLTDNGDGTWSITFTPRKFYGIDEGVVVTKICAVFNGCDNWASEAKDHDGQGGCMDFFIPIKFTNPNPTIAFRLNMNKLIKNGTLDPGLHQVFAEVEGFDPVELLDLDANLETDGIYEGLLEDTTLKEGNTYTIKFYYDDGTNKVYEDNPRSITLVAGKNKVDVWWNDDPLNITTFLLDMNAQIAANKFDPNNDYVDVAGSFNNWDGKDHHLTDVGGGWYEIKLTLEPGTTYEYKFRINGDWNNSEFPGGGPNRKYTAVAKDYTVKHLYDNWDPSKWPVTFNCIMKYQLKAGHFDPANDFLDVAGNFNGWTGGNVLTDENGDSVYSVTVFADTNTKDLEFKFRINGDWATSEFPGGGPNRKFTMMDTAGGHVNVFTAWYNDDDPAVPAKPIIYDVKITGNAYVDSTITVEYTYEDVNGDAEGATSIQWFRSDDAKGTVKTEISGATSKSYTITSDDNHKYLFVRIVPVSVTMDSATMYGDTVWASTDIIMSAGLAEYKFQNIRIYPNPSHSTLTLENLEGVDNVVVYDLLGKKNLERKVNSQRQLELNISELKTGVYILNLQGEKGQMTYKFLKK